MIAASHQKQFQLYSRPIRLALAGAETGVDFPNVVDAYRAARRFTSIAHAELAPAVDEQSTTEDCSRADNFWPETDNAERR